MHLIKFLITVLFPSPSSIMYYLQKFHESSSASFLHSSIVIPFMVFHRASLSLCSTASSILRCRSFYERGGVSIALASKTGLRGHCGQALDAHFCRNRLLLVTTHLAHTFSLRPPASRGSPTLPLRLLWCDNSGKPGQDVLLLCCPLHHGLGAGLPSGSGSILDLHHGTSLDRMPWMLTKVEMSQKSNKKTAQKCPLLQASIASHQSLSLPIIITEEPEVFDKVNLLLSIRCWTLLCLYTFFSLVFCIYLFICHCLF